MIVAAIGISLAGCATDDPGIASLKRGAADAFEAPICRVYGRDRRDQRWIDGQVEAGVIAFGWRRPQECPRDTAKVIPSAAPTKKTLWRRVLSR